METLEENVGDIKILHLRGRLDLAAAPAFESRVKLLISSGERKIVLDCRDLKYVSSSGIGVFVTCAKGLSPQGKLIFVALNQHVESLFELTGLSRVLTICKTKEDAVTRLSVNA